MRNIFIAVLLFFFLNHGIAQDSVMYTSNTKVVLDHLADSVKMKNAVIRLTSFVENDCCYYNVFVIKELSYAIFPQPSYYNKYRDFIIVYQNYSYYIQHSGQFMVEYVNNIKRYVENNVVIDSYEPLQYHWLRKPTVTIADEPRVYCCYKVKDGNILSFEMSNDSFLSPCMDMPMLR